MNRTEALVSLCFLIVDAAWLAASCPYTTSSLTQLYPQTVSQNESFLLPWASPSSSLWYFVTAIRKVANTEYWPLLYPLCLVTTLNSAWALVSCSLKLPHFSMLRSMLLAGGWGKASCPCSVFLFPLNVWLRLFAWVTEEGYEWLRLELG